MLPRSEVSARRPIYLCWKSRSASFRIRLGSWIRWVVKSSQRVAITTIYNTRIWYLWNITIFYIYFSMCAYVETEVGSAYKSHGSIMKWLCQAYVKPVEPVEAALISLWRSCCSQVRRVSGGNRCRDVSNQNSDSRGKQNETKDFNRQQHLHEFMSKFHLGHIQISYWSYCCFHLPWNIPWEPHLIFILFIFIHIYLYFAAFHG